jgi:hypothetical protein
MFTFLPSPTWADTLSDSIFRIIQLLLRYPLPMDQISIKTPKPKCRLFFKIDQERYLAAGLYLSEVSPLLGFLFGVVKQFRRFGMVTYRIITHVYALHTTRFPPPLFNPHQNDQGRKGPCFFQRLIAQKCLIVKKLKKISNPPLVSYLSNEPNFWLIK